MVSLAVRLLAHPFNTFFALVLAWRTEASCASAVRTARAATGEAGSAVAPALHSLARKSEKHAEHAVHKTCGEFDLALPIPLTPVKLASSGVFHVLMLSDWLRFVLNLGSNR